MSWTITIGRVAGTEVKVHLTFFILVAFWAMQGYQQGGNAGAWQNIAMESATMVPGTVIASGIVSSSMSIKVASANSTSIPTWIANCQCSTPEAAGGG